MLFEKRRIAVVFIASLLFCVVETSNFLTTAAPYVSGEGGTTVFYTLQMNASLLVINLVAPFLYLFIIPFLYSNQPIKARMTHFDFMLLTRQKNEGNYWLKILATNAAVTFLLFFCIQLVRIVIIRLFYAPFYFEQESSFLVESLRYYLFKNSLWNLIAFVILSALGRALFATLVLVVGMYLKNYVLYLVSGLVLGLLLLVGPGFLGILMMAEKSHILPHIFFLGTLTEPGLSQLGIYTINFSGLTAYLAAFLTYSVVIAGLFWYRLRLDKKSGW